MILMCELHPDFFLSTSFAQFRTEYQLSLSGIAAHTTLKNKLAFVETNQDLNVCELVS